MEDFPRKSLQRGCWPQDAEKMMCVSPYFHENLKDLARSAISRHHYQNIIIGDLQTSWRELQLLFSKTEHLIKSSSLCKLPKTEKKTNKRTTCSSLGFCKESARLGQFSGDH